MSDRDALAMAVAAVLGAMHPRPIPVAAAAGAAVGAILLRRPLLLVLAVCALTSGLGARALDGLQPPDGGDVTATVTLVTDPRPSLGGLRAEARLGARRVELRASGVAASALADRLAGERIGVRGVLQPLARPTDWTVSRHLSGALRVHLVERWSPGDPVAQLANGLRRTLETGAAPLGPHHRSLYTGLVIGDDRAQPAALSDDFQGAGLTHLLAVSGQNVAFVLALAGPLLRRLRLWPRALLALGLIGTFGVMTRFEPSVVRATAMAVAALLATTVGSPLSRLRLLALAATAVLLVDPLLVRSVGFQLSAAATTAIVVLARPLEEALPGPPTLRAPLAVTVAAQLGVAPVLISTFGPIPVASLPANLLAVPAAGLVMVWGLTGGLVAGAAVELLPGAVARFFVAAIHLPTRVLLTWLAEVGARCAALPLGHLGAVHVLALSAAMVAVVRWRSAAGSVGGRAHRGLTWVRRVGLAVGGLALAAAVAAAQAPPALRQDLQSGVVRWHAGGSDVVVLGGVGGRVSLGAEPVLARLREAGVGSIELLVVADASPSVALVAAIEGRHPVGAIVFHGTWRGDERDTVGAARGTLRVAAPGQPEVLPVGRLEVRLTPTTDRLVVEARRLP